MIKTLEKARPSPIALSPFRLRIYMGARKTLLKFPSGNFDTFTGCVVPCSLFSNMDEGI
jgi:hypothetical protein